MDRITAAAINTLAAFLGPRDGELETMHADVFVLFGGSILAGGDEMARAMRLGTADKYIIVGGEGHTTQALRDRVRAEYPAISTQGRPEAEVFRAYLEAAHGLCPDLLETRSTNCGNNITFLLDLMREKGVTCRSVILCQDAGMQRRMGAGMRKQAPGIQVIHYAAYRAEVGENGFVRPIHGMWDMDRYVELLMGEIPRLTDDENGYGPRGKGFIAHEDVPRDVLEAFAHLKGVYAGRVRAADPRYASEDTGEGDRIGFINGDKLKLHIDKTRYNVYNTNRYQECS